MLPLDHFAFMKCLMVLHPAFNGETDMETKTYPSLYKKTATGAVQQCDIRVQLMDGVPTVVTRFGLVGGKFQEATNPIKSGKNVGRANATTPWEQALSEAQSKWERKVNREHYGQDSAGTESSEKRALAPMLAQDFYKAVVDKKTGIRSIKKPIVNWTDGMFIQPKSDGRRCMSHLYTDRIEQYSRSGELIQTMSHITEELRHMQEFFTKKGLISSERGILADGELYTTKISFEDIGAAISTEGGHEHAKLIDYHTYDALLLDCPDMPFKERHDLLAEFYSQHTASALRPVETVQVFSEEEMLIHVERWVRMGFEGGMIRSNSPYDAGERSKSLLKVKNFDENEYEVIDFRPGDKGKAKEHCVFMCRHVGCTGPKDVFDVTAPGTHEQKKRYLVDGAKYIGRKLTVKHFGFTIHDLPRFPVAKAFRDHSDM